MFILSSIKTSTIERENMYIYTHEYREEGISLYNSRHDVCNLRGSIPVSRPIALCFSLSHERVEREGTQLLWRISKPRQYLTEKERERGGREWEERGEGEGERKRVCV